MTHYKQTDKTIKNCFNCIYFTYAQQGAGNFLVSCSTNLFRLSINERFLENFKMCINCPFWKEKIPGGISRTSEKEPEFTKHRAGHCPACGSEINYQGLFTVECSNSKCKNFKYERNHT